ncbi:LysR family transcriptional regulator [Lacisediminimonas profundi]|uniref:LysR family transcriptional regulator n=1 Tax=Lacisediminimonas profundi TaxID=2603856 RepID=UPI00124BAD63|nr:LysR family transcriptional regulator [Lacisediminimonas profundi]
MNVRFLETFIWLAKLRNFRLTAERLHTTQASVSNRIASLEQDFGVALFNRSPLGVNLTPEGAKALVYAERILKLAQQMERDLSDNTVVTGTIRIGVIDTIVHSWLPQFLERIQQLYPKILIELNSDTTVHLSEQLLKGNLDLSFQGTPVVDEEIVNTNLCAFPMRWVASPMLGMGDGPLEAADLARFPVISFSRRSLPHNAVVQLFSSAGIDEVHINSIASVAAMIRLAVDGFGVAVLPPAVITHELASQRLQLLETRQSFPDLVLSASHRPAPVHPVVASLVSLARQVVSDFSLQHGTGMAVVPREYPSQPTTDSV